MNRTKKILSLVLAAAVLMAGTVAATVAWLTSEDNVVNTFTVGDVEITLDEVDYDADSNTADNTTVESETRDKANEYHLIPGKTYAKDPTVHVDEDSEDCYLFVKVVNEIEDLEADPTIADQMAENGWVYVDDGVYVYGEEVEGVLNAVAVEAGEDVVVFESFTIGEDVSNSDLADYAPVSSEGVEPEYKKVDVTAYAIQTEGFDADAIGDMMYALGLANAQ